MARVRARGGFAPRRACVKTFGCQQNESDSERLRGMLLEMGYALTDSGAEADVIVLNTCAVREHAEARVFGVIGALTHRKRENPGTVIAV
ncbi:MAG: tRNA (N6-isopentenyl adenosine(37)-C2)-methylthiotransferase MiaB, partial [Oscillospiraceae bacterium]|nr:tRNA (N6-isopentenyl adenosine(37)-C2)-methylthiotransferase MiaB [Oscillospiraceae bacterium]